MAARGARSSERFWWLGLSDSNARYAAAFRKGLNETANVEGQNVTVEYHWLEAQYDRLPALMADLVRREVAAIATVGTAPTLAAKAATGRVPIAFGIGEDPVQLAHHPTDVQAGRPTR